jgi:hypothetical protein
MKELLKNLRENSQRSSSICLSVIDEYSKVRDKLLFFDKLLGDIQRSHSHNTPKSYNQNSNKTFFLRENKVVLLADLEPPETLEPEIERVFLGDVDQKKMFDGNLGYRIRTYPTLSNKNKEVQEYLISFDTRKWELVGKKE